ncbi:hypothetical protein ACJX0J_034936 [Zea mays]
MPNSIDDIIDMELEKESMGTATQFEQATMETIGDHGTEGQVDANFALVCTQDWLRRSTPINIQENIEELTIIEKGMFHYFCMYLMMKSPSLLPYMTKSFQMTLYFTKEH